MKPILSALFIFCLAVQFAVFAENNVPKETEAKFSPWLSFKQGDGPDHLLWLTEDDGSVLAGPFQGPMAFLTDAANRLWAGDSLNARICVFSSEGKLEKTIDLFKAAKEAGLASDPVLAEMIFSTSNKLLIADAANNAVLQIDPDSMQTKAFQSFTEDESRWLQINFLHCDKAGNIFIEDLALQRTVVIDSEGRYVKTLEGQNCMAVSATGRLAVAVADNNGIHEWHILAKDKMNEEWQTFALIRNDEPIHWIGLLGYDASQNLFVAFETPTARHYAVFDKNGNTIRVFKTRPSEPGYDPCRSEWVSPDGRIHQVSIASSTLNIMVLN